MRGNTFGFVFQNFMLFDRRSALANVSLPLYYGAPEAYRDRRTIALAALSGVGLREQSSILPSRLSGGEQQRVAIARALVRNPECILADEPTGSLDINTASAVLELLFSLVREKHRSMIVITHDPAIASLADRKLTLVDGRLTSA